MFFTAEDDDTDFLSPGGSKLASVFGMDKASNKGGNEALTYTAPKQPKKKEATTPKGAEGGAAATGVNVATVVHTYKLVDGQYVSQGKVGAAILVNHAAHEYRVLLYVSKQQQLTNAKITPTFAFNVQANNYANFYDDARVNWSIMFTSAQDVEKFAKEVGLCKALSTGGQPASLVQQELQLGSGGLLESGDMIEVKYTGWLLSNNTFGSVFDSNANSDKLFRFKVGKGKVIKGWDQGMLGMQKGGKRLLVIPPSLAYGSQGMGDRVPGNATLIFEVEVRRVKGQKGENTPETPQPPAAAATAKPSPDDDVPEDDGTDDTVKERSKSITEQLSNSPTSDKAKLISRMAKMGKPMLPAMSGAVPAQPDSEEEPHSPQPTATKPPMPAKPHHLPVAHPHTAQQPAQPHAAQPVGQPQVQMVGQAAAQPYAQQMTQPVDPASGMPMGMQNIQPAQPAFLQNLPAAQQMSVYQPQPTLLHQQQQAMLAMQQQQMGGVPMATSQNLGFMPQAQHTPLSATHTLATSSAGLLPGSSSTDAMAPMILSETRQQNTEMRMAVSKISDKVDRILEKVENSHGGAHQSLPAPTMETSILLHNITRIVQENERLKKEVYERGETIETQNDKISELLQKNQRYVERSNLALEERNEGYKQTADSSQLRILALEQEKVRIATELSNSTAHLATLQLELGELRKKEGSLRQELLSSSSTSANHQEELERLRLQRTEDEKKLTDLAASLREEKAARRQSEQQLTGLQEEMTDLKATCSTLERNVNERKRKAAEERKKAEEDAEDMKAGYEKEIASLRNKLRRQRSNTDADRVSKLEDELAAEWQAKCDKLVATATDKHARQLANMKEELQEAQDAAAKLEAKVQQMKANSGSADAQVSSLQQQLEESAVFKDKFESLRGQATVMKQRYEERIAELEQEVESMASRREELVQQVQQARMQQMAEAATTGGADSADVATEVKKVMNSVYQSLRGEFDVEENYTGAEVMMVILGVIKETTLKLVQGQSASTQQQDDEDEEDDEEDEDESEEEEEEEQEEADEEAKSVTQQLPKEAGKTATPEPTPEGSRNEADHSSKAAGKDDNASQEAEKSSADMIPDLPPVPVESSTDSTAAAQDKDLTSDPDTDNSFHTPPSTSEESGESQKVSDQKEEAPQDPQPAPQQPEVVEAKAPESDKGRAKAEAKSEADVPTLASREPPPMLDEEEDDSLLFGSDNTVADTLGPHLLSEDRKEKESKLPSKSDLLVDDDMKPKPPPPLFGDDDDDEDLDWLS